MPITSQSRKHGLLYADYPSKALIIRIRTSLHGGRRIGGLSSRGRLAEMDVVVAERLAVNPASGRGEPGGDLAALVDRLHERTDERLVGVRREPLALAPPPLASGQHLAFGRRLDGRERANLAVECDVRQRQPMRQPGGLEDAV